MMTLIRLAVHSPNVSTPAAGSAAPDKLRTVQHLDVRVKGRSAGSNDNADRSGHNAAADVQPGITVEVRPELQRHSAPGLVMQLPVSHHHQPAFPHSKCLTMGDTAWCRFRPVHTCLGCLGSLLAGAAKRRCSISTNRGLARER